MVKQNKSNENQKPPGSEYLTVVRQRHNAKGDKVACKNCGEEVLLTRKERHDRQECTKRRPVAGPILSLFPKRKSDTAKLLPNRRSPRFSAQSIAPAVLDVPGHLDFDDVTPEVVASAPPSHTPEVVASAPPSHTPEVVASALLDPPSHTPEAVASALLDPPSLTPDISPALHDPLIVTPEDALLSVAAPTEVAAVPELVAGMEPVLGVSSVLLVEKSGNVLVLSNPIVYKTLSGTYKIFGKANADDVSSQMQSRNAETAAATFNSENV